MSLVAASIEPTLEKDLKLPIDPRMISLAREARGWNQAELASEVGVTQGHLSKLEAGLVEVGPDLVAKLADALACPPALLEYQSPAVGLEVTCLHHRRRASTMGAPTRKRIEALARLTRISVDGLFSGVELVYEHHLARADAGGNIDPVQSARDTRVALGLDKLAPIPSVVAAVESAGVVIVHRALGTASQDAVSTWPQAGGSPMMLVNTGLAPDRLRFTIAHELGHLVMHAAPGPDQETQADTFASAFLAPAESVRPDLVGLTTSDLTRLVRTKTKWGMSVAALVRRARDLGEMSEATYKDFVIRMSRLGWRRSEPGAVEPEMPTLVPRLIKLRREKQGLSVAQLANLALMNETVFRRYFLSEPETRPTMKLVINE